MSVWVAVDEAAVGLLSLALMIKFLKEHEESERCPQANGLKDSLFKEDTTADDCMRGAVDVRTCNCLFLDASVPITFIINYYYN